MHQRGSETRPDAKLFGINIVIPKPLRLNILRGIFAEPAPDKAFEGVRGRGTPVSATNSHFGTGSGRRKKSRNELFFRGYPQAALARKLLRDRTVQVNRFVKLPLLDELAFSMRDVNRSRTDQQRFPPIH